MHDYVTFIVNYNLIKCTWAKTSNHPITKTQLSGGQCIFNNITLFAFAPSVKDSDPSPLAVRGTQTEH